jgi:hypothetical protein
VDVEAGVVGTVITVVPLRSAPPSGGAATCAAEPKGEDSNEDSDVRIVSSVGEASRGRSPTALGHEAPRDEDKSSSTSTSSSNSSSENTEQSASPSATGVEKDDFVAAVEEDEEEEEPESSNYRVTPEEPQAAAARLQIPPEAKLIGGKQIRFLGLMSGGHEHKFLEEAGSSFATPPQRAILRESQLRRLNHRLRGSVPESLRSISVSCPKDGVGE